MKNLTPRINNLEPNLVIDGGFEIWPEGTSRSIANNSSAYGAALFKILNEGSGVTLTNTRQTAVPSNTSLIYSNEISKTAAGTLSASMNITNRYVIEGYDLSKIYNKEFSIIFWVKSSVASNRSVSIRNGTGTHSFVKQYNIAVADTWELKVLKVDAMSTCPGALDRTNGNGATLTWGTVIGSNFQTSSLNQWISGTYLSGVGEDTTWLTGTTHNFSIAGVMILPGDFTGIDAATYNFVRAGRSFQEELAMSQRYVEPMSASISALGVIGFIATPGVARGAYFFRVTKRTSPTFSSGNGTWVINSAAANTNVAAGNVSTEVSTVDYLAFQLATAGLTSGQACSIGISVPGSTFIGFDSRF
jgi:hypothetical protein